MPLAALWFKCLRLCSMLRSLRKSKITPTLDLPEDVLLQILVKLPVKSIGQCMSVNKQWHSLLKSPSFISSYNSPKSKRKRYLVLWKSIRQLQFHVDDRNLDCYNSYILPFETMAKRSRFPAEDSIGICNGVICIARSTGTFVLWNPFIKKLVNLPSPNVTPYNPDIRYIEFGFAFDSITNDYKVLRILKLGKHKEHLIEIFSLNHNSWKSGCRFDNKYDFGEQAPVLFNGVLHWLVIEKSTADTSTILGFDVNAEFFRQIKLPDILVRKSYRTNHHLIIYEDSSLAVVSQQGSWENVKVQLWVMEEYGNVGSWANIWKFDVDFDNWYSIIQLMNHQYFTKDLLICNKKVISDLIMEQDLETIAAKKIVASHVLRPFEESLVLLDNANAKDAIPISDDLDAARNRRLFMNL